MPTNKPRIQILLEPESYEVIKALADETGMSMASFVKSVVEASLPGWKGMLRIARKYKTLNEGQLEGLTMAAEAFDQITLMIIDQIAPEHPEKPKKGRSLGGGTRRKVGAPSKRPPSSNTGVKIP